MQVTRLKRLFLTAALLALPGSVWSQDEGGVQEAGTETREERTSAMSETVYRRLTAIHEVMGEGNLEDALKRLRALEGGRLNNYEKALVLQTFGFVYAQQGKYGEAIKSFEACIATDALPNAAQQGMLYSLSGLYAAQEQYAKTVSTMETWFKFAAEPVDAGAYMLVGSSHAELGQLGKALPYVQEAIKRAKEPKESWYLLELSILFEQKSFSAAAGSLRKMVTYWPDKPRYWEMLSSTYLELEQDHDALAALMLAHKKGLVTEEAKLLNLVRLNMFLEIPFAAGNLLETEIASGQVESTRRNLELLLSAWTSAREFDKAIGVIDRLAPAAENGDYYFQKAQLFNEKGNWSEVVTAVELALEKGGLDKPGNAYVLMGMAQTELANYDAALRAFESARKFDDNSRRNAVAWIDYVNDRRQVTLARNAGN